MHNGEVIRRHPLTTPGEAIANLLTFLPGDQWNLTLNWVDADHLSGSSQAVALTWMALGERNQGRVRYRIRPPSTGRSSPWQEVAASASDVVQGNEKARYLRATLTHLLPSTCYQYQLVETGPQPRKSAHHEYRSHPRDPRVFTFAAYGDSKAQFDVSHELNAAVLKDLGENKSWFVVQGGDFGAEANFREWQAWFNYSPTRRPSRTAYMLSKHVFLPIHGNHENLAPSWFGQFAAPSRSAQGQPSLNNKEAEGRWYSFNYGPAHFVVLTSGEYTNQKWYQRQLGWLREDLAANRLARTEGRTRWTIVSVHHTLFTSGEHLHDLASYGVQPGPENTGSPPLVEILEASGMVDLVIAGHDHDFERSKQIRGYRTETLFEGSHKLRYTRLPGSFVDPHSGRFGSCRQGKGTIYLTLGGAGASQRNMRPLETLGDSSWIAYRKPAPEQGEDASRHPCYHYARIQVSPQRLLVEIIEKDMSHLLAHQGRDDGVEGVIDRIHILGLPRGQVPPKPPAGQVFQKIEQPATFQ
jgi:hypothetical protein